jgi:hypothetical protein
MIAPTADGCKRAVAGAPKFARDGLSVPPARQKMQRHGIVREIIIRPNFRPATALLSCNKRSLRWPGPFSPGFLSPQPPGAVGIGPVRRIVYPHPGPTRVGPFSFRGWPSFQARAGANPQSRPINFWIPIQRQDACPQMCHCTSGMARGPASGDETSRIRRKFLFRESGRLTGAS